MSDSSLIVISILFVGCCLCLIVYSCFGLLFSRSGNKTDDSSEKQVVTPLNINGDWKIKSVTIPKATQNQLDELRKMIGTPMKIEDDGSMQIQLVPHDATVEYPGRIRKFKVTTRIPNKIDANDAQYNMTLQATKDLITLNISLNPPSDTDSPPVMTIILVRSDSAEGKSLPPWTPPPTPPQNQAVINSAKPENLNINGDWKVKNTAPPQPDGRIPSMIGYPITLIDSGSNEIQMRSTDPLQTFKVTTRLQNELTAENINDPNTKFKTNDGNVISLATSSMHGVMTLVRADSLEGLSLPVWTPPPRPTPSDNNVQAAPTSSSSISSTPALA